jgi:fumarylacetoacetate (FAA) hydrolase family protein
MGFDAKSVIYGAMITATVAGVVGMFFARLKKSAPISEAEAQKIADAAAEKMGEQLRKECAAQHIEIKKTIEAAAKASDKRDDEVRADFRRMGETMLAAVNKQDARLTELTMHLLQQRAEK